MVAEIQFLTEEVNSLKYRNGDIVRELEQKENYYDIVVEIGDQII